MSHNVNRFGCESNFVTRHDLKNEIYETSIKYDETIFYWIWNENNYLLYFITYKAYLFFQQILNIIYNLLHTQNPMSKSIPLKIINFRLKQ